MHSGDFGELGYRFTTDYNLDDVLKFYRRNWLSGRDDRTPTAILPLLLYN